MELEYRLVVDEELGGRHQVMLRCFAVACREAEDAGTVIDEGTAPAAVEEADTSATTWEAEYHNGSIQEESEGIRELSQAAAGAAVAPAKLHWTQPDL